MNFSDKLKRIIELEEINLKNFSDLTGLNYDTVRRYKAGSRSPTFQQIQKILSVPRFEKYTELLLSEYEANTTDVTESGSRNPLTEKSIALIKRLEAIGKGEEAFAILQAIEESAKK